MAAATLSYEDLGLIQGEGWLFRHLDVHIRPRDRLALIGRNGVGKTTLLKCLAGLIDPDEGRRTKVPGSRIVLLEQDPDLGDHATLLDWVLDGADAPETHEAAAIADQLAIDLSRPVATASGGERRRAAIVRALAQQPDVLLLDEPTNHLDLAGIEWLEDWLGRPVLDVIDMFVSASPVGRIAARAGSHKTTFNGNWKYVGMDGYHTNFTHKIVSDLVVRKMPEAGDRFNEMFSDRSPNLTWDLGRGHCRLDTVPAQGDAYARIMAGGLQATEGGRSYLEAMQEAYGDRTTEVLVKSRDPHLGVWPNLQLIGVQIRVIRPIAVDRTEVILYPTLLEGVPDDINEARLRSHEWFYGPAGFGQPDDGELFERNQLGLMADVDPWLYLARGLGTERHNPDGTIVGNITDETTQRGQMRQWLAQMADGEVPAAWQPEQPSPTVRRVGSA